MVISNANLTGAVVARSMTMDLTKLYTFPEFGPEMLAEYLRPHVEAINRSVGREAITIDAREDGSQVSSRTGGGFAFGIGFRTESEDETYLRNRLEEASGIEFRASATRNRYLPHRARVHFLARGTETQAVTRCRYVKLDAGDNPALVMPAPVPQWFTSELVDGRLRELLRLRPGEKTAPERLADLNKDLALLEAELKAALGRESESARAINDLERKADNLPRSIIEATAAKSDWEKLNEQLSSQINQIYRELSRLQQAARNRRR
jgi:hypothetical protein